MSLMTYQETRPWARSIRTKVEAREMPPWHIDPKVGVQSFKNDVSLSDDEIAVIGNWVQNGAPRGNPEDAPAAVEFQEFGAWTIEPDVIVTSPPHTVPAEAGDWWGDYIVPSGIPDDRYIKAIQTRAGDLRVVHHALTYAVTEPDALLNDSSEDAFLNEYAVGKNADVYPDGTGRLFPGDARVRFSLHYHSVGEELVDSTEVGIWFHPKGFVPKYRVHGGALGVRQAMETLDIPPGKVTVHHAYVPLALPARLENYQPHMHIRGKAMSMEAIYPDGRVEMLNHVADFDFNWHVNYVYTDDSAPVLPAGTVIHLTAWHDNTEANRANPDHTQWVGWGQRSYDDMYHAHVNITYLTDEDYEQIIADRRASRTDD